MKLVLIISGKGGTGKTVISGALAALVPNKVMADCDVDATDLHLLVNPSGEQRHEFKSGVLRRLILPSVLDVGNVKKYAGLTQ